jgi:transcriptional/translational regulatory protein YebC/TACO1
MKSISPIPMISLDDESKANVEKLLEVLGDLDDVVETWSNLD